MDGISEISKRNKFLELKVKELKLRLNQWNSEDCLNDNLIRISTKSEMVL